MLPNPNDAEDRRVDFRLNLHYWQIEKKNNLFTCKPNALDMEVTEKQ